MKAVQTRSPIHLAYEYANLNNVIISIWVSDSPNIDSTTTPDYQLNSQAINNFATVEISELIRSKNDYIFNPDFYEKRDTAKYVLVKALLLDDTQTQLEVKYDFLRARDGYLRRVDGVTEKELPQVYKNLLPTDFNQWIKINTALTSGITDSFSGTDAYVADNVTDGQEINIGFNIDKDSVHTLSVICKSTNSTVEIGSNSGVCEFDVVNNSIINQGSNVLATDITNLNNNFKIISAVFETIEGRIRIKSEASANDVIVLFNPSLVMGNRLNASADELLLQDNNTIPTVNGLVTKFGLDRKIANTGYSYGLIDLQDNFSTTSNNSVFINVIQNGLLTYQNLQGVETFTPITRESINECKHTPVKVSFINRFGVIQDLVFFKKRTDSIDTDKESYVTNVLQKGNYYSHIGQTQTIRKESKRSVTLNSGFYPEEFNTVFEQLQNSLYYWIDDEPAVLEGSSFNVKTRVNDKLINYTFDFSYSNEEVNTI